MTSDSGVTDIDQPLLTPPKSVTSPLNWFDTSSTIPRPPATQQLHNSFSTGQSYNPQKSMEEEKAHLLANSYLAASQESTESAQHYKQALNSFDKHVMNTNNSGYSGADTFHGAIPYRVRSRENMVPFSPSPEGFQNNPNILRLHQRIPSAPPSRIPTQYSNNAPVHMRQRSADLIGDNSDQFFFPPYSHHSEPNFDMHIEPDWYLSPNSKPKYQKSSAIPINTVPSNHTVDWMMRRRSDSPSRFNVVQSHSGRSTPVRQLQYPVVGNTGGSTGKSNSLSVENK